MSANSRVARSSTRNAVLGIALLAVVANVLFLAVLPGGLQENENTDYFTNYEPAARNLLAGRGPVGTDGQLIVRYPPGFSMVLATLFKISTTTAIPESAVLCAFNVAVAAFTASLVFLISSVVFGKLPSLLAAACWALYPVHLWLNKQPNSEIPFFVPLFLAFYLFVRTVGADRPSGWQALGIGAFVAVASLIRPIAIGLGATFVLSVWWLQKSWPIRKKVAWSVLVLATNVLVVAPWIAYARAQTGHWILLSTNGRYSMVEGLWMATRDLPRLQEHGSSMFPKGALAVMREAQERQHEFQSYGSIVHFLADKWKQQPVSTTEFLLLKALRAWYGTNSQRFDGWIALLQIPCLVVAAVGMRRAWRHQGTERAWTGVVLLVTLYFWGMSFIVVPLLRYMLPVIALLMSFLAVGIVGVLPNGEELVARIRKLPSGARASS